MGFLDRFKKEPEKDAKADSVGGKGSGSRCPGKVGKFTGSDEKNSIFLILLGGFPRRTCSVTRLSWIIYLSGLDKASVSVLDTQRMDEQMVWLTEHLEIAVREGRGDTAERIIKALMYGVGKRP